MEIPNRYHPFKLYDWKYLTSYYKLFQKTYKGSGKFYKYLDCHFFY